MFALLQEDIARLSEQLAVLRGQFADKTAEQLELQVPSFPRLICCGLCTFRGLCMPNEFFLPRSASAETILSYATDILAA